MGRAPATPSIFIKSMSTLYDSEPPWSEAPDPLPWSGRLAAGQAHGRENWSKAYLGITLPRRLRRRRHRLQSTYGPGDHKGHIPGTHTHHMAKKSVTLLYLAGVTALRPTLGMLGLPRPKRATPPARRVNPAHKRARLCVHGRRGPVHCGARDSSASTSTSNEKPAAGARGMERGAMHRASAPKHTQRSRMGRDPRTASSRFTGGFSSVRPFSCLPDPPDRCPVHCSVSTVESLLEDAKSVFSKAAYSCAPHPE